jgi:hypothetical protein
MPTVVTAVTELGPGPLLIQNHSGDPIYVLDDPDVSFSNGVRIDTGRAVAVGGGATYYATSDGSSDVRLLSRGTGIFDADIVAP